MTRNELINRVGGYEQAEAAIEILLSYVEIPDIKKAVDAEARTLKKSISRMEEEGVIISSHGLHYININADEIDQNRAEIILRRMKNAKGLLLNLAV